MIVTDKFYVTITIIRWSNTNISLYYEPMLGNFFHESKFKYDKSEKRCASIDWCHAVFSSNLLIIKCIVLACQNSAKNTLVFILFIIYLFIYLEWSQNTLAYMRCVISNWQIHAISKYLKHGTRNNSSLRQRIKQRARTTSHRQQPFLGPDMWLRLTVPQQRVQHAFLCRLHTSC